MASSWSGGRAVGGHDCWIRELNEYGLFAFGPADRVYAVINNGKMIEETALAANIR